MFSKIGKSVRSFFNGCGGAYLAFAILFLICYFTNDSFGKPQNIINVLRQMSFSGIIALGMTYIIIAGGIDLSVGSLFAFTGIITVLTANALPVEMSQGCIFVVSLLTGLLCGLVGALINGGFIILGKIPPFIATLGTYSIFRSLSLYFADSGTLSLNANIRVFNDVCGFSIMKLPMPVILMLIMTIVLDVILTFTRFGKYTLATGASERVSIFSGININKIKLLGYIITGICIGLSSVLYVGRLNSVSSSNAGSLYELDAIAAVIIGGAAMSGGKGTVRGTLAGILILGIVSNILDLWGINPSLQGVVKGFVIIISVLIQRKRK